MDNDRLRRVAGIVGLACYWPYLRRFEFERFFGAYADPSSSMWAAYTVVTWLNVALLVAAAWGHVRVESAVRRPMWGAAAGLLSALGYGLVLAAPAGGPVLETAGSLAGSALVAGGFCGLTVAWMCTLVQDANSRVLKDALLSFALCCALSFTALLPAAGVVGCAVGAPVVSGVLWAFLARTRPVATPGEPQPPSFDAEKPRAVLVVAVVLMFLIGRITAGLLHFDTGAIQVIERCVSVAVSCAIVGAIYATSRRVGHLVSMVRQAWLALVVIFMAGEAVVVLGGGVVQEAGMAVLWASLGCFEVLALAVVAMWCQTTGASPVVTLGLATVLVRVVPGWVGKYAVPAAMDAAGIAPASTVGAFVVVSSVLLVSSTFLLLNTMVESGIAPAAPAKAGAPRDSVARLAQTYLLTPRESDVLALLLQGLSYQAIADRLEVTLGTVQTHTKGLYRKMDVHSRDELVKRAEE